MSKLRIVILLVFLLVFGAGVGVGVVQSRMALPTISKGDHIATELSLSSEQQEKMKEIWSSMGELRRQHDEKGKTLSVDRDAKIKQLLSPEQATAYEQVLHDHEQAVQQLRAERHQTVERCIQRTREILSPEQATKYEQMLQRRRDSRKDKHR